MFISSVVKPLIFFNGLAKEEGSQLEWHFLCSFVIPDRYSNDLNA